MAARGRKQVREQRLPAERMQDLGQRGAHPLAFARGKNCDLQRHFHRGANYRIFVPCRSLAPAATERAQSMRECRPKPPPSAACSRGGEVPCKRASPPGHWPVVLLLPLGAYAADACKHRGELDTMYCDDNSDMVADVAGRSEEIEEPVDDRLHLHAGRGSRRLREYLQAVHDAPRGSASTRRSCSIRCSRMRRRSRRCARAGCTSAASRPARPRFAVNLAGAVPFAVKGTAKEFQGYNLIVIVKASSPYQKLSDLKGKKVAHTCAVVEFRPHGAAGALPGAKA